jgi:hypothetical protein
LIEHARSPFSAPSGQRAQLDLLGELNRSHAAAGRAADLRLEARVHGFEAAYRMQAEAGEAFDVGREPRRVRELYGDTPVGRQCLLARRLVARGVRFVQVYHGDWDHHDNLSEYVREMAPAADQAVAALLIDLKRSGLLNDTLVIIGGEFGRSPTAGTLPTSIGK